MKLSYLINILVYLGAASAFRRTIMDHQNWELIPTATCGIVKVPSRIVDGEFAKHAQFPWMAQIFLTEKYGDKFICGGALFNDLYVLTAAHCVANDQKLLKKVRLGDNTVVHQRYPCAACQPKTYRVDSIIVHPEYNESDFHNDIALIRLNEPVEYNNVIRPICLPNNDILDRNFIGEQFDVAGWGFDASGELSQILQYVRLPMRDTCTCASYYEKPLLDSQFCVGAGNGQDTCGGDSGGPLVWSRKENFLDRNYVLGLVSYGSEACGEAPAVYTNVIYYIRWILDNIASEHPDWNIASEHPDWNIASEHPDFEVTI